MEKYKKVLDSLEGTASVILKNVCEYKVTAPFLFERLIEEPYKIIDKYVLHQDAINEEYRLRMEYEPYLEFKNISIDFERMLKTIAGRLTGKGCVEVQLAYQTAKRGRND